jgi:hypothetical protein
MIARLLRGFAFSLLVLPLVWAGHACAANKGDCKIRFSTTPDAGDAKEAPLLRPNQKQDYYLFVENFIAKDEEVTVEVSAGGKPIEGGSTTFGAKAKSLTLATLGKPAGAAEKAPPPPAPLAPPEKPAAPQFAELKGDLKFAVYGKDAAGNRVELDAVTPALSKPSDYVEVTGAIYDLKEKPGIRNQLVFKVRAKDNFRGGRCRVDIALKPDRIPGFVNTPKKEGTRGGFLQQPGDELTLTANNLQFRDLPGQPDEKRDGIVYLTVDGYERAFIFKSTFPRGGVTESALDQIRIPVGRLNIANSADPAKQFAVALEVDNTTPEFDENGKLIGPVIEVSLDRDANGKFDRKAGEVVPVGIGNRRQQISFNPAYPNGALQLETVASDWGTKLDVAEIYGLRLVRFRLLKDMSQIAVEKDEDRKLIEFLNSATDRTGFDITQTVVFDGTPPEELKFVDFPEKLVRGAPLPVKATAVDPESGIADAVFYVGKPGPDGNPPATAVKVKGKLVDAKAGVWAAALDAPTEQKGKVDVTAQFTNGAGLVKSETVVIQLVDSLPGGGVAGGKTSIEGKVVQGDRPQPKVPVFLRDAAGGVKDTTMTDDNGGYIFKDVMPGTYRVFANKTGDNTKGEIVVQVLEGQKKTAEPVSLVR